MLRSTGHSSIADRTRNLPRPEIGPSLALPQVWRPHGSHRTTYRCSNPTPFSTSVAHHCGMKQLAHNSKTLHGSPRSAPVPLLLTRSLPQSGASANVKLASPLDG